MGPSAAVPVSDAVNRPSVAVILTGRPSTGVAGVIVPQANGEAATDETMVGGAVVGAGVVEVASEVEVEVEGRGSDVFVVAD